SLACIFFFFQAEDGIRDRNVTGVQTCALPIFYISTPDMMRAGAARIQELGVKPEMEIFDTGQLRFARTMIDEGLIDAPPLFQLRSEERRVGNEWRSRRVRDR